MAKKSKTEIIQDRTEEIKRLRSQIADIETAAVQVGATINAILYEVVRKYGDEEMQISISVPNVENAKKVSAEKKDDTYVIRVTSEPEE